MNFIESEIYGSILSRYFTFKIWENIRRNDSQLIGGTYEKNK